MNGLQIVPSFMKNSSNRSLITSESLKRHTDASLNCCGEWYKSSINYNCSALIKFDSSTLSRAPNFLSSSYDRSSTVFRNNSSTFSVIWSNFSTTCCFHWPTREMYSFLKIFIEWHCARNTLWWFCCSSISKPIERWNEYIFINESF